ncbi:MAG: GIY-YIG nuclease family protein [Coprothermobacterota bacterium]|nr:GIY-YIG nuclease family protein [Coprothermobacterota bacterium]
MNKTTTGYSVRIFIPSGEPEGLRIVEESNWTGQGLVFPRLLFSEARQRLELKRTGVYILWGPGKSSQLPCLYVGEGDDVLLRLEQHIKNKDFWTHAMVFTSKDQNLNKAHVHYLEARLLHLANEAKRCELDNGNVPQIPPLSEADQVDAASFLGDMLLCLPVVGINLFEKATVDSSNEIDLLLRAKGIEARGAETPQGFVVRSGSRAVKLEVPSCLVYCKELRAALVTNGVLKLSDDGYIFTQDYLFSSPSTAADVVLGLSANGRIVWKTRDGRTLKALQESEASS